MERTGEDVKEISQRGPKRDLMKTVRKGLLERIREYEISMKCRVNGTLWMSR